MHRTYSSKFDRPVIEVYAGEYQVTTDPDIILSTLLGSCVAVCIRDKFNKVAGINHIMLSNSAQPEEMLTNRDARYGIHAMEMLINELMKEGASRQRLEAKVFGGGKVLAAEGGNLGYSNIEFAVAYLENEEIPILAQDTGGQGGRKIYFSPEDFTVYLKRVEMVNSLKRVKKQEEQYLEKLKSRQAGENYLFGNGED